MSSLRWYSKTQLFLSSYAQSRKYGDKGTSLAVQWLRLHLAMQEMQVWPQIWELRSHMRQSQKTPKYKNRNNIVTSSIKTFFKKCALSLSCSVGFYSVTAWTVACQALLSMGFSQQEYWSELPFTSPGDLQYPRIEPESPVSPALQAYSLPMSHLGIFLKNGPHEKKFFFLK